MAARQIVLLAIALGCALLLLAASAAVSARFQLQSELAERVPCGDRETEDGIRKLLHEALDNAMRNHFEKTFEVWMRDETDQPRRARRGVRQGINAYLQVRRNLATEFKLMECPQ